MENLRIQSDHKLTMILQHAPIGMAEIDRAGKIIQLNPRGENLLEPIRSHFAIPGNNLFPILDHIAPNMAVKIKEANDKAVDIITNELHSFSQSSGGETIQRHFQFMVTQLFANCIIVSFDDVSEKWQKDQAMMQLVLDKAIAQEKFEIAANVLHDIGNAVVGFGSYLTRIKRTLEENTAENLQNLMGFFETHHAALTAGIGEAKADAVLTLLGNITETQKASQEVVTKSITEQHNIINHIQEILNIQRQYMTGNNISENKPTKLRSIIDDCISMLYASMEKRGIRLTADIPVELPLVNCNRTRIMQVLLNIFKNSIEAIDIRSLRKAINLIVYTKDDLLVIEVVDTGNGFNEATGSQLFERGFTTKSSGTGIGLNSCRAIIESFDGTIDISSEGPGKGALTRITFKI
jgi:signal transduction histidine kinase